MQRTDLFTPHSIDNTNDSVQPDVGVPFFIPPERLCYDSRIGDARRLKDDVVKRTPLSDEFLDGGKVVGAGRAAEAAVWEGEEWRGMSTLR